MWSSWMVRGFWLPRPADKELNKEIMELRRLSHVFPGENRVENCPLDAILNQMGDAVQLRKGRARRARTDEAQRRRHHGF